MTAATPERILHSFNTIGEVRMAEEIFRVPPDLMRFLSLEEHQLLVSAARMSEEIALLGHIEGLYGAAMSFKDVTMDQYALFQLLTFSHYHLLFTMSCQMKCHLSEAFASVRVAIDAALIAGHIIADRPSQVAYAKGEKPFDNYARYLGNMIKDGKPLPHPLMKLLVEQQKKISTFAAHADMRSFVHRVRQAQEGGKPFIGMEYFQFARNDDERKLHTLTMLHTYVMVLDVFSGFLMTEAKVVPAEWRKQLHGIGATIERRARELAKRAREAKDRKE
jgi:hypothetical protein